jgi:isoleucyl-tRNA synthetase
MKNTLNLPKTDFPMRANLAQAEPARQEQWRKSNIYQRMQQNREGLRPFVLHDGPPYANGDIHIGHALNKILKDFIVKHNYFDGKAVHFNPGWDCHGLPIEKAVNLAHADRPLRQQKCREYAAQVLENQK